MYLTEKADGNVPTHLAIFLIASCNLAVLTPHMPRALLAGQMTHYHLLTHKTVDEHSGCNICFSDRENDSLVHVDTLVLVPRVSKQTACPWSNCLPIPEQWHHRPTAIPWAVLQ